MEGMCENLLAMENLKPFVKKTANKLKVFVVSAVWYTQLPFTIFAEVVWKLVKAKSFNEDEIKKKSLLVFKVHPIFLDIVKIGIEDFEKDCVDVHDRMKEALDFMKEESNFEDVVCGRAWIGKMQPDRNDFLHPFSRAPKEKRQPTLDLFEMTLDDKFLDKFWRVGLLGLMKLKTVAAKKKKDKVKDINIY